MSDDPNEIGPWVDCPDRGAPCRFFIRGDGGDLAAIEKDGRIDVWFGSGDSVTSSVLPVWTRAVADTLLLRLYPPRPPSASRVVREATIAGVVQAIAVAVEVAVKHRLPGVAKEIVAAGEALVARIRSQPPEGT